MVRLFDNASKSFLIKCVSLASLDTENKYCTGGGKEVGREVFRKGFLQ